MAQRLSTCCSYTGPGLVLSTHIQWLTIPCNYSFSCWCPLLASAGTVCTHTGTHTHVSIHKHTIKNKEKWNFHGRYKWNYEDITFQSGGHSCSKTTVVFIQQDKLVSYNRCWCSQGQGRSWAGQSLISKIICRAEVMISLLWKSFLLSWKEKQSSLPYDTLQRETQMTYPVIMATDLMGWGPGA